MQLLWSEDKSSEIETCEKVLLLHKLSVDIAADSLQSKEEAGDDLG